MQWRLDSLPGMLQTFVPCSPLFVITAQHSLPCVVRSLFALVRFFHAPFAADMFLRTEEFRYFLA
jgi:hypothetical protein